MNNKTKLHYPMQRTLILLFFVVLLKSNAQVTVAIYVDGKQLDHQAYPDTLAQAESIRNIQLEWVAKGYLFSGIDSIQDVGNEKNVYLHRGEKYDFKSDGINGKRFLKEMQRQLNRYTNNGYPFASVFIDSSFTSESELKAKIQIEKGPEIRYDSAVFLEPINTNKSHIYQLLDIVPGKRFSERDYGLISEKIERSPFLRLRRQTDLSFRQKSATVYLDLEEFSSNTFQGVLGVQQGTNGKTEAIGSLDLNVQNLFRSGKQLRLFWERFTARSQRLNLFYKHPFLLGSKISPSFEFDLLRQDTSFLVRTLQAGLGTYISSRINLQLSFENRNASLISSDVASGSDLADFDRRIYAARISKGFLEKFMKRESGLVWQASLGLGSKTINKNLELDESYYDTIRLRTNFYQMDALAAYQLKLGKRQSLFHQMNLGWIENSEILANELYRIGGLNSLRGFNEKNFFAQNYALSRLEVRSFFEEQSYAYLFYDQLFFKRNNNIDFPVGIGVGFVLDTSSGQFSFALASGRANDTNFSFENLRTHFGYISRF